MRYISTVFQNYYSAVGKKEMNVALTKARQDLPNYTHLRLSLMLFLDGFELFFFLVEVLSLKFWSEL